MTRHTSRTSDDPALNPRVRTLLDVAAAPAETTGPLRGEEAALAAFRASPQSTRRTSMLSPLVSVRAAVASALGTGVLVTVGVGAAAAGVLPGAAQETASNWLETVGISVPAGEKANEKGDLRGRSGQAPGEGGGSGKRPADKPELPPAADHGQQVSDTAKHTTAEGADKGKEIAGVASDGRVESGDRGSAGEQHGGPPVSAPNSGGTGTASDATDGQEKSDGASDRGTTTADESSDGASSDGSGNRPPATEPNLGPRNLG
jgi:hypothetical protein